MISLSGMVIFGNAQSMNHILTISDLQKSIGKWRGTLTYLDYTSGKPYTMPADIIFSFTENQSGLIRSYEYPDEPKANAKDTLVIEKNGTLFNKEKIASQKLTPSGDFTILTEYEGVDGNENKVAIIRHTYSLEGNGFSIKKEVKFIGTDTWIKRNEYLFTKEVKVALTDKALFTKIAQLDSLVFAAYNTQNMPEFKKYFTENLEWFQDNGGLLDYETVFRNFQTMFNNENKLTRELVKGSLEVHPIKNYGAIEIGKHLFKHMENGKLEIGEFRFLMIWKNDNGNWRLSKVVSYDH